LPENYSTMKRNTNNGKVKDKFSPRETLPLLRGMFICPEPLRRLKNVSGQFLLNDIFTYGDSLKSSVANNKQPSLDEQWTLTEEGFLMSN